MTTPPVTYPVVSPLRGVVGIPLVEFPVRATVAIVRGKLRGKCVVCHRRRELYRVVIQANGTDDATEARCGECWGIR